MKHYTVLTVLFISINIATHSNAAALDQSGQSIQPFLENGNYIEFSAAAIDIDISGKIRNRTDLVDDNNLNTGNMGNSSIFYNAALKLQLSDQISFGLLFDQPFGADIRYPIESNHTFSDKTTKQSTYTKVNTKNISMIWGISPYTNFQIYGGAVYQSVNGTVSLRGNASTEIFNGYDANFKENHALGWLTGLSYQIPDIALKTSLTYRSKIHHDMQVTETFLDKPLDVTASNTTKISTPQSVNIDFQTGVSKHSLAYVNLRWVNWKDFQIQPTQFGAVTKIVTSSLSNNIYNNGFNLDSHQKDQWTITLGLGHQFTEKLSASTEVSWDSGTGNPASTLNPTKGYWGTGLGIQFNPTHNYFISAGVKYFWLGNAIAEDGTYYLPIPNNRFTAEQADFKNNNAIAYGLKIGYHF